MSDLSSPGEVAQCATAVQALAQDGADNILQAVRAHATTAAVRHALGKGRHRASQHNIHQHPQAPHVT